MAGRQPIQKGQFYAAKYQGTGGDLIIGEVQSVRTSGHIVLTNLLTNQTSTKKADVLKKRNKRVSKSQAKKILKAHKERGRDAARAAAISAPEFRNGRNGQLEFKMPPKSKILMECNKLLEKMEDDIAQRMSQFHKELSELLRKHRSAQ